MIFVTVGISFPFDRLIKEVDRISNKIPYDIFAQIGYADYIPKNFSFKQILSEDEFQNYIDKAKIVITHGGFGCIFNILKKNKPIIAVPKTFECDETANDQTELVRLLESHGRLIGVYDILKLEKIILEFNFVPKRFEYNLSISEDIDNQIKRWFFDKC